MSGYLVRFKEQRLSRPHWHAACDYRGCAAPERGVKPVALRKCARCHGVAYCGKRCQERDWPAHKHVCTPPLAPARRIVLAPPHVFAPVCPRGYGLQFCTRSARATGERGGTPGGERK
jgi:hypothetical protein